MINEIRTYDLKPRAVPEYLKRYAAKLAVRLKLSPLGGHWHTEIGLLNQVVANWPYTNLEERELTSGFEQSLVPILYGHRAPTT